MIDPTSEFQTMRGWGSSLIPWDANMRTLYTTAGFQKTYAEDLNFNILRVSLSEYALPKETAPEEIDYRDFILDGRGANNEPYFRARVFLDFARALSALNPDFQVITSTWSAPAWMKTNRELSGGSLDPKYDEHYARWMVEWARLYASQGVRISAMSIVNEPKSNAPWNTMFTIPSRYVEILARVRQYLDDAGFQDILLFGPEDISRQAESNRSYAEALADNPAAFAALGSFASHPYIKDVNPDDLDPSAEHIETLWRESIQPYGWEYWMTEGGSGDPNFDNVIDEFAPFLHRYLKLADTALFTFWQVSASPVSIHAFMSGNQHTIKSAAIRHYSRPIRPGMVRIWAQDYREVQVVAFKDEAAGRLAIVMVNPTGFQRTIPFRLVGLGDFSADTLTTQDGTWLAEGTIGFVAGRAEVPMPPRSLMTISAEGVDFSSLPTNTGSLSPLLQVPGYAGETTCTLSSTDPAFPWVVEVESAALGMTMEDRSGADPQRITLNWPATRTRRKPARFA